MKKFKSIYKPFIKFNEDVAKRYGFEITEVVARKFPNGFISVYIGWKAKKSEYKFKYPVLGGAMYAFESVSYDLDFPQIKYKLDKKFTWMSNFCVEVGIWHKKDKQIKYKPLFHQNTKYSSIVWFAPKNWENYDESKVIFDYENNP